VEAENTDGNEEAESETDDEEERDEVEDEDKYDDDDYDNYPEVICSSVNYKYSLLTYLLTYSVCKHGGVLLSLNSSVAKCNVNIHFFMKNKIHQILKTLL